MAWAKTIAPQDTRLSPNRLPTLGERDSFDQPYWSPGSADIAEAWGLYNYALAVVISQDCAIDKEFFQRLALYRERESLESATSRANDEHEREAFILIAEVWPIEHYPEHLRRDAESGSVGYVPFRLDALRPDDKRIYSIDLSRLATVSARSIWLRVGIGDEPWRYRIQMDICKYFAARSIRLSEQLDTLVASGITDIEALGPPTGGPPRARVRVRFGNGQEATLEGILPTLPSDDEPQGPSSGFKGRGQT